MAFCELKWKDKEFVKSVFNKILVIILKEY